MEWLSDFNTWMGLITLVILEIVLGIDNLVFIAILSDKLPINQRKNARILGLMCALCMRIILLSTINWITTLNYTLFYAFGFAFSLRDIIMIIGGIFLLGKCTIELHARLEGVDQEHEKNSVKAVFWQVIAQIIILDAIFSLDSIITAVGMVKHIYVMIIAIIISMSIMMIASNTLMYFINRHRTIIILCLGFLMMIGFNLVVEGFGVHIPKGYLYVSIGFSILIESLNQIGYYNRKKFLTTNDLRSRTSIAVLRLLGGIKGEANLVDTVDVIAEQTSAAKIFYPEEKEMIKGVLDLVERPVRSIMSPRNEVEWLDLSDNQKVIKKELESFKHSRILLAHNKVDEFVGVAFTKDLLLSFVEEKKLDWQKSMRQPLVVHENTNVLCMMEKLRRSKIQLAIVVDEHGSFEGIITPTDILEAIAGDFPDDDELVIVEREKDGSFISEGYIDIRRLSRLIDRDLVDDNDRYTTLAGYILWHFGYIPIIGESFKSNDFKFEVLEMDRRNITKVRIKPIIEKTKK